MSKELWLECPWAPSLNHYWMSCATKSGRVIKFVGKKGLLFREQIEDLVRPFKNFFTKEERLEITLYMCPPDRRRRDVDNYSKALLDALQHAGLYHDDCQIDSMQVMRNNNVLCQKTGKIFLQIAVIEPETWLKSRIWKKIQKLCAK